MAASFEHLRTISREAIAAGVVPGLAVVVGEGGLTRFLAAFGQRQLEPRAQAATDDTMWDLASLTKALCTSVLTMQAISRGVLSLDEPLMPPSAEPTVRQVLAHAGGFSAHLPLYRDALGPHGENAGTLAARGAMLKAAAAAPQAYPPGTRSIYSDLGFIMLGARLEERLRAPLDRLFETSIVDRLPAPAALGFRRIDGATTPPIAEGVNIAATQRCPLRGRVLVGEVDDLNAYALGGVAGHAGLFGTPAAVAALAHALCAAYRGAGARPTTGPLVDRQLLRTFWQPAGVPDSTWRLGWDGPSLQGSLAGDRISRGAVGHLAFTGCSLWIDPERESFVVMLSNRVHPTVRTDARFSALRRAVNDVALAALGYG